MHLIGLVGNAKTEPFLFQPLDFDGVHFIGAAYAMTKREQQPGDTTHSGAGDADQMHAARRASEEFCKARKVHRKRFQDVIAVRSISLATLSAA
jgi:hypothetical protein